tara:strand:- start:851 stop:1090 length:240 start_codon:yes stop_codon:yes gene_type:complete
MKKSMKVEDLMSIPKNFYKQNRYKELNPNIKKELDLTVNHIASLQNEFRDDYFVEVLKMVRKATKQKYLQACQEQNKQK